MRFHQSLSGLNENSGKSHFISLPAFPSFSVTTIKKDCLGNTAFAMPFVAENSTSFVKVLPAFDDKVTFKF